MIEIRDLTFAYSGRQPIFEGFNLNVNYGDAWSVIGPSGCGKTTFLYLLAGLRRPASGSILIDEIPVLRPRPRTGLVLQDHGLLPWSTVDENARLGLNIWQFYGSDGKHAPTDRKIDQNQADQRVDYWLKKLGILGLRDQYPARLSRGQRQRTAIARTLVMEPDLLLLDEPFSGLSHKETENISRVIRNLNDQGLTVVIIEQRLRELMKLVQKVSAINFGQKIAEGTPTQVQRSPAVITAYVGEE